MYGLRIFISQKKFKYSINMYKILFKILFKIQYKQKNIDNFII